MNYNGLLDHNILEDYLDGKLDAKTMHQVEKLSLEDPFIAEALAGLSESLARKQSLSLLQKQLYKRIAQKPIEDKRWKITAQRLSIASAAAVLFITVSLLFWMKENNRRQIEANQAKNVKIEIAPSKDVVKEIVPNSATDSAIDEVIAKAKAATYAAIKKPSTSTKIIEETPVSTAAPAEVQTTLTETTNLKSAARMSSIAVTNAAPVDGFEKFDAYILKENKFLVNKQFSGKAVQLSFKINESNRPIDILVVKGLDKGENDEAIRLLRVGPDWINNSDPTTMNFVSIKF